ncbi:MAG: DUF2784 domain-containing protein [Bacteroidales bacterium]|nr:DUF2784 domain-containing protein [Bacteroidales bacterium]
MLLAADYFFTFFHLLLILFNLFGWIWKPFRKIHFATISLTLASWFILGIWYGWGYCPFTDWHWQVLRELGYYGLPSSYISFLVTRISGYVPPAQWVDGLTIGFALLAFIVSIKVNFFRRKSG